MAIKINFVLFERTFRVIYEDPLQRLLQCAVRHLGIIIDLIN